MIMTSPNELILLATSEIENILIGYEHPEKELFNRYLSKKDTERESFVLALTGLVLMYRKKAFNQKSENE